MRESTREETIKSVRLFIRLVPITVTTGLLAGLFTALIWKV